MKHLAYLLFWLSIFIPGHAALAESAAFPAATLPAAPLALPDTATHVPVGMQDGQKDLPPPPPLAADPIALPPSPEQIPENLSELANAPAPTATGAIELRFDAFDTPVQPAAVAAEAPVTPPVLPAATVSSAPVLDALFDGKENSLVAKAVGAAEGTRTPDGGRNPAYYGHTDPGNGVWNLGSFSYQHAAASPEDADARQLARLRSQADQLVQKAADQGLALTVTEKLNGIDLANQAPLAALGQQGYVDWLAVAKAEGKPEADAVLSARVRSFIDPRTQQWNAPGLGNSEERITHDQARRMAAIDRAILASQQQLAQLPQTTSDPDPLVSQNNPADTGANPADSHTIADTHTIADSIPPANPAAEKTIASVPNEKAALEFSQSPL